ncbi:uncharacterized protein LOC144619991, partial [Crassostrea virginica]
LLGKFFHRLYVLLQKLNNEVTTLYIPVIAFLSVSLFIGTFGNLLVIIIYTYRQKKSSSDYFILCLSFLDLITCFAGIPLEITDLCLSYTSAIILGTKTVDLQIPRINGSDCAHSEEMKKSAFVFVYYIVGLLCFFGATRTTSDVKVTRTTTILAAITIAFILSYLPYLAAMVTSTAIPDLEYRITDLPRVIYKLATKSVFLNNALNPLIYSFLSPKFRSELRSLLSCKRIRN